MKTYRVKLILEEVEVNDTPWGHAVQANAIIANLQEEVKEVNSLVNKAYKNTQLTKTKGRL